MKHATKLITLALMAFVVMGCAAFKEGWEDCFHPRFVTIKTKGVVAAQWYAAVEKYPLQKTWCVWGKNDKGEAHCWLEVEGKFVDNYWVEMPLWIGRYTDTHAFYVRKRGDLKTVAGMGRMASGGSRWPSNGLELFGSWPADDNTIMAQCRHIAPMQYVELVKQYGAENCQLVLGANASDEQHMWVEIKDEKGRTRYVNNYWVQQPLWTTHPRWKNFKEVGRGRPWEIPNWDWKEIPMSPNSAKYQSRWSAGVH